LCWKQFTFDAVIYEIILDNSTRNVMKNITLVVLVVFFYACKHDNDTATPIVPVQGISLSIGYNVDNTPFRTDSFMYYTDAGYQYDVTMLDYYLSQISLIKPDSSTVLLKDFLYVCATDAGSNHVDLKDLPIGDYIGLQFNIGLDSLHNCTDALPATTDNLNMQWPEPMGGGYHFLRFEGHYAITGFAMHLGTSSCLIPVKIFKHIIISKNVKTPVNLVMNINEWFRNPYVFDFDTDGNYIMGNAAAMQKIAGNGVDVFNF
jgi:hypothetical protein